MRICIAGKNNIAVDGLQYLLREMTIPASDLCVTLNKVDTGVDSWQKSLKKAAKDFHVAVLPLEELYSIENLVFLSLEYERIIKPSLFASNRLFNMHFSLLPAYKGVGMSYIQLLNGESKSGVTLHHIDDGIDTGDVIAMREFPIGINDTSRALYFKFIDEAITLFKQNISSLLSGGFEMKPQPALRATYFSKKFIRYDAMEIDFKKTSFEIHNQIRALIFPEYQLPAISGSRIESSTLTKERIGRNECIERAEEFIVSGIDGFKIILKKERRQETRCSGIGGEGGGDVSRSRQ
ncbi:MAG: hypothetical protein LBJ46_08250 [Planctomycetota bacterium]|jgi:methionyl-tRNA formyltransferase|nr:hypothetical protein [Planctomycetota bacterium]